MLGAINIFAFLDVSAMGYSGATNLLIGHFESPMLSDNEDSIALANHLEFRFSAVLDWFGFVLLSSSLYPVADITAFLLHLTTEGR